MSRAMAETSLQAYQQKQAENTLQGDKQTVYKLIKKEGPISCKQAARMLRRTPNQISGRFTELREEHDLIEVAYIEDNHRFYEVKD